MHRELVDVRFTAALLQAAHITQRAKCVEIPQRAVDGWQYSPGDNAVIFSGHAVPRPGMVIMIYYDPWIGPSE